MPRQKKPILLTLCALTILLTNAFAEPISSPEIASKSIKLQANSNNNNNLQQQQQQHQQQNDAHLNSLTVYATNYDNIASAQAQVQPPTATSSASASNAAAGGAGASTQAAAGLNQTPNSHFKPSYRLPEMETNFTPLHSQPSSSAALANLQSTPMLMQYLPAHSLQDGSGVSAGSSAAGGGGGGIQYLQLIPTRPIIVPISPYLAPNGAPPPPSAYASLAPTVGAAAGNTLSDYAQPPTLAATHRGVMPFANAAGLHAYANSIVPYRAPSPVGGGAAPGHHHHFHRFNREAKDKHYPHTMSLNLNLNEYLPATHEATARAGMSLGLGGAHVYMRGRP